MKNVLILCAHRPRRSPSQRYRFEQYIPFLEKHGFRFTFSYLLNQWDDKIFYSHGRFFLKVFILFKSLLIRVKDIFRFKKFDIIFIQREATFFGTSFFEKQAYRSGARVIFDFDDSIWLADTSPGNLKWEWLKKPSKFFTNLTYAHCVLAGNNYLAEKARPYNNNVQVIPTTIDTDIHKPLPANSKKETLTIGWSGSISTVKHFELLMLVLEKIKELYGQKIQFKIIGDPTYHNAKLQALAVPWSEETEVQQLNSLDIGIMPLPDDEWANGKCGLKGLAYMACGVPAVLSEVGVNREIIRHGENGLVAGNEYEWYNLLRELIEHDFLREEFAGKGRQTVIEKYSVEAWKNKYLEIFENAGKSE